MRYIRTENGRIVDLKLLRCSKEVIDDPFSSKDLQIILETYSCGKIVKQADTIEKLCDEFIVVSDNCKQPIISALPFNELQLYAKDRTKYATCYGAIWTYKGLFFIAKMNEKGELNLLDYEETEK